MKIKHIWSVLCEKSIINQDDNVISLLGILETINTTFTQVNAKEVKPEIVNIPFNFEVVNYWVKETTDEVKMKVKTAIVDPNHKELTSIVNDWVFPKDQQKLRGRLKIQGLPVSINGDYKVRVSLQTEGEKEYETVAEIPLLVTIQIAKEKIVV